jgi:hypothetical protein
MAGVDTQVLLDAQNVLVGSRGYIPVPDLNEIGGDALPANCVGLCIARTTTGSIVVFAGTTTKLYKLSGTTWTDVSRLVGGNYAVPVGEYWQFAQYGDTLIAVNIADVPQAISVTGGVNFAALGGSPPKARYVAVVGDFVVLACLDTDQKKLINSAINNPTGWTVGTNLCDDQTFGDGGRVVGCASGEFGYVVQEKAIRRMIFQPGSDVAFRFERVSDERGAAGGYSLVSSVGTIFFLTEDGFYLYGASGLLPIGQDRVNRWFNDNADTSRRFSVLGFADVSAPRVYWAFYNMQSSTIFDRVICYDWQKDKWTYFLASAQFWAPLAVPGKTLEDLNVYGGLEDVPFSLDSRVWEGGQPLIAAISTNKKLAFLDAATPMTALIAPAPVQFGGSGRARLTDLYPTGIWNDATVEVRIGKQDNTSASINFTAWQQISPSSGWARPNANAKVFSPQFRLSQSSGVVWKMAQGYEPMFGPAGAR